MGVLPKIVGVDQYVSANGLLKAGVELIAKAGLDGHRIRAEHVLSQSAYSGCVRQEEVFIERRFKRPGVGHAQNGSRLFDVVSDAGARLRTGFRDQTVIAVQAETNVELEVSHRDPVLRIECVLINVGGGVEGEQPAAAGEIERKQAGREGR